MNYDKLEKIINESFEKKEKVGPKSDKKLVKAINETIDLVDSGETAKIVKEMMPNSKFVVLYAKTSGKKQADLHLYDFKDKDWLVFPWEQD